MNEDINNYSTGGEEKKEKLSIRYSTKEIWILILIISVISILGNYLINSNISWNNIDDNSRENFYSNAFYNKLNLTFNGYDQYSGDEELVKYHLRAYGPTNYEFTEEFKEKYPDIVVVRNNFTNEIVDRFNINDLDDLSEIKEDYFYEGDSFTFSSDITEKPNYVVEKKSNLDSFDGTDPQEIDFTKNEIGFKGYFENGKLTLTSTNKGNLKNENERIVFNALRTSVDRYFSDFNNDSPSYSPHKINFYISVDLSSNAFKNLENEMYSRNNEETMFFTSLASVLIALFVIAVFASITDYKKAKNVGFYKGISKFPIEIVMVLLGILLFGFLAGIMVPFTDYPVSLKEFTSKNYIVYLIEFLVVFFTSVTVYYGIHGLKSIYNEGGKSFVFHNSITIRAVKWVFRFFKNIYVKIKDKIFSTFDNLDALNKKNILILYFGLIIFGIFACSIVVRPGLSFIVWILWVFFITTLFNYAKKYYLDLVNISEKSKIISEGNYDVKINEDNTTFKDIAHSFNVIGDNLNEAVEKAIKSERLKTELITNVSHDLKTPLTSIINYSELIVDEESDFEKQKEYAKIIHEKSLKLKKLIEDLFEVTKVTSKNIELHFEDIDFKQLVNQIVGEWSDKFEEKRLDINMNITDNPVVLNLDGNKTSRILDNLFSNIYKYTLEGTRVYIDLENNDAATLVIKNISKYPLNISADELMERFTRGDSSRQTEGSGLGLSIASSLVDAQGGSFEIEIDGDLFKTIIEFE
ncbi:sensor histidine kinase [Anaerosphaera multitolerans]|uniref:histidine kinase n=1 Tax=Anaerosphaera multitolerans TaxID=2487351 RepID=A0A437S872_9FIRM|nr:HAMP domain-containing sensor histidine kinase [Anaerosphaera multitolerans]RVU55202.1 sensor histidine kinase [Anaerosphaera multitolerans]